MTGPMTTSSNITTRQEAALSLMENVLREGRPLAHEYPLVFGENAAGHIETLESDGEVASTCAWLARTLLASGVEVPVSVVGSVATREDCRGQGLGTEVLNLATSNAAAEGAALSLLWADDPAWYQERGWVPFGSETIYVVDETMAFLLPEPTGVRAFRASDAEAIHGLYCGHSARVDRTLEETSTMLSVPGMQVFVCEKEGQVTGYACMNRGEDLGQVIHEWSGAPDSVLPVISKLWEANRRSQERLFMMVPPTEADYLAFFEFVKARGATGILAMAKLGNTETMAGVFDAATPDSITAVATGENTIDLTGEGGTIRLTDHEILLALCPPRGDRRVTDVVEAQTGTAIPALPLRPFVWGLDSI